MQTTDAYVEEVQTEITNEVNVIAMVLLVFAAIALFVSVLVIANTFTILFAQRTRDFALLRCVGATRRQVLRSIRLEALCLGVVASLLGLLVGTGLGHGLVALARSADAAGHDGDPDPSLALVRRGVRGRPARHAGGRLAAHPARGAGQPAGGTAPRRPASTSGRRPAGCARVPDWPWSRAAWCCSARRSPPTRSRS